MEGRIRAVITENRKIGTPLVINAAGVWAAEVGRLAGLEIPIKPRRGQIVVTAAVPPLIRHCLISAQYVAVKFTPELAATGGMGFSAGAGRQRQHPDRLDPRVRGFRPPHHLRGHPHDRKPHRSRDSGSHARAGDPHLRGLRPYTPDGLPILGKVAGLEGFIMAAGHEGDGIALSPITGELIADLIATGRTQFPLEDFRLERFRERTA